MTEEQSPGESSGWVVEPPANGLRVSIEFSEDAEITPDLRGALERLVRVIEDETAQGAEGADGPETAQSPEMAEAAGFQVFRPRPKCPAKCPSNMVCQPEQRRPCADKYVVDCTIVNQPCQPALI